MEKNDEGRPLTPKEREKLRVIIDRAEELALLADSYSHMSFFGKAMFRIATWLTVIVGTVLLVINFKTTGAPK